MKLSHYGHLAMLAFSALVAGSFALGVLAANEISPSALNALRFWIATAIIGVLAAFTSGFPKEAAQAPWRYFLLGVFFAAYFVLMFRFENRACRQCGSGIYFDPKNRRV